MYVYLNDSSDEFENDADQIQNGRCSAIFSFYFGCASFNLIVLKLGMYVHLDNSSVSSKMALIRFKMAATWLFSVFFPRL